MRLQLAVLAVATLSVYVSPAAAQAGGAKRILKQQQKQQQNREQQMPKGYWIGRIDVKDEEGYKPYIAANGPIFKKFGGKLIVRGGPFDCVEGTARSRNAR